jgi:hypothetical protein
MQYLSLLSKKIIFLPTLPLAFLLLAPSGYKETLASPPAQATSPKEEEVVSTPSCSNIMCKLVRVLTMSVKVPKCEIFDPFFYTNKSYMGR